MQVNSGPFDDGWLMKLKLSNKDAELDSLMKPEEYQQEIE